MTAGSAPRLEFAGVTSVIGPAVLALFWLLGVLGVVGVAISLVAGKLAANGEGLGGFALLLGFVGAMTYVLVRDLRAVRTITCAADGAWILRSPIGVHLGTIAAETPRKVRALQRKVWMFANTASRYTQSWVEIETEARTYRTCKSIPKAQAAAIAALRRPPFSGGG
ncbi:MAG: hypothetical protein R2939_15295 [Kofleriaceae bacterium]